MAGGIFPNYPFEVNIKCVIFSIIIIALFFYQPPKMNIYWKSFSAFLLFVLAYVAMAWYDYIFNCQKLALKKSQNGVTDKLKPEPHTLSQTDRSKTTPEEEDLEWRLINLFHILVTVPLLIYVGINKNESNQLSIILLISAFLFAIVYHGVRLQKKFNSISLLHILFSVPIIYYLYQEKRPEWFYGGLIGLAGYTGLKHGLYLIQAFH